MGAVPVRHAPTSGRAPRRTARARFGQASGVSASLAALGA